jgi:hypothetical protein
MNKHRTALEFYGRILDGRPNSSSISDTHLTWTAQKSLSVSQII